MKKLILGMVFLGGLIALPVVAEQAYPLHARDAQYSWMWDVEPANEMASLTDAKLLEDDYDTNDLGW